MTFFVKDILRYQVLGEDTIMTLSEDTKAIRLKDLE